MDFHTLNRRELQALCKKNKIPANITNVAMADALTALEFVEGIEEVMKPSESETANSSVESPEKSDIMSSVPRNGRRTATRKTAKKETEMSQTMTGTCRSTRRMPPQNLDEVKNEVIETPAAPTARRRAAATSVHSKMEILLKECVDKEQDGEQILNEKKDVQKTPGAVLTSRRKEVKVKSSVQQVYSTRRSARIAAKYEETSKQDTEISRSIPFDSFTDETDEMSDVNSKLCSLHLNEVQGKSVADSSASNGNENQTVASKELNVDMNQSYEELATKEITNGLIENYATEGLSAGKESNDVEVDLQQSADLLLKGQEVVGDNIAVSKQLDDGNNEPVAENAGALCGVEVVADELTTNEISRCEVEDNAHFKGQKVCGDEMILPVQDGEDEDNIYETSDCAAEDVDLQTNDQEIYGDNTVQYEHLSNDKELHQGHEISHCEVKNADALSNDEMIGVEEELDTKEAFDTEVEDADLQSEGLKVVDDKYEQFNNDEISEHLEDASDVNVDAANKDVVFVAPVLPLASLLPEVHAPISTLIPSSEGESNSVQTFQITCSTPIKKPSNKTPIKLAVDTNLGVNRISDDKENIDNSGMKLAFTKEEVKKMGNAAEVKNQKPFEDASLRQLRKMMKEKLHISEKNTTKTVSRPALQQVSENCLIGESKNSSEI